MEHHASVDAARLGGEYRMNEPSTDKAQNWSVRIEEKYFAERTAEDLRSLAEAYGR